MEKQRLTLENVQEIGLDLLKKENYNSNEFQIYWDYNDQIVPDDMEEIREIKDKIGTEHLSDAVAEFILERNSMSDYSEELIESVLKKYCDYNENSEEYQNLKEELDNIVFDEFTFDVNEMDLLRNSYGDVQIILCNDKNDKYTKAYDEEFLIESYKKPDLLKEELHKETFNPTAFSIENQFNPMVFLIQSQGYEVEDLYNKEKIESSPFLTSLKNAIDNAYENEYASISFMKENLNLVELFELEETKQNIKIPKETMKNTEIVLEKDIVIDNKHFKIVSDYSEEKEETNLIGSFISNKAKIELTDEKGFETKDYNIEKIYEKAILDLDKEELEEFLESDKLPIFDEFIENKIVSDITEKYSTKKFERIGKDEFKNLSDIEVEEEFSIDFKNETLKPFEEKSPYLLYERYGLEDELPDFKVTVDGFDFFNSKNNNEKLEEKLKEEKNINIKDIVEFSNHIKETFKNDDVEILFEKENGEYAKYNYGDYVENTYDELLDNIEEEAKVYRQAIKEEIDNITDKDGIVKEKDLKKVFDKYEISADYLFKNKEIKNVELEEKAPEKENTNNNEVKKKLNQYEKDLIKDIVDIFNGVDIFKDKEIKNIEAEEKTPKKEYTNNNELKEEIRSYQQDIIEAVVENEFEKISKNEYKLKDNTLLNKENWEKELKTDKYKDYNAFYIFDNTMTRTEMVERYDLDKKLSPFEIYTNDGDLLYNSASENNDFDKIREYAKENLANYDFEEFINEDLTKFENWQKVTTYDVGIGITELNGEKKQIYDVYDYTDPVYKELCQEIDKERVNFEEEIRLSFKEHIDNNIIKSDDLLKVFKKFDNGNDKRLERFEEKINDTEISTKEVGEKLKDREKDF